jgi:protein-S-isoprenylcysteine O-methyltransferase Ste14
MEKTRFHYFYTLRGALMAPWLVFMVFSTYWECERHWVFPLAFGLFGAGFAIRVWAQMHLHYRLKVRKVLTTTGPYRFVRNPIYIANTLILLGACIMSELLWLAPFLLIWCCLVYSLVVRHEERHLTSKYGQAYLDYMNQAPRWLPRAPALGQPRVRVGHFAVRSVGAEMYCFLYILPFVLKEIISDMDIF